MLPWQIAMFSAQLEGWLDTFTEGSDTTLASHTPDQGTSWSLLLQNGTPTATVIAASDVVAVSTSDTSIGVAYKITPDVSGADYEVKATLTAKGTVTEAVVVLLARCADANNWYYASFYPIFPFVEVGKKVSGTVTALDDDAGANAFSAGDVLSLVVTGTTIEAKVNGSTKASATDSDLSAAGAAGLGFGNITPYSGDKTDTGMTLDDFTVTVA